MLRGRSQLSTFMYSYRAYGGGGGHGASIIFLNVDLVLCCHLAAMIERMQSHMMDCCGTAVIYKTPSWERFDVTMPPSSFGLNSYCDPFRTRSIPRDFRQRMVNELAQHSKAARWV